MLRFIVNRLILTPSLLVLLFVNVSAQTKTDYGKAVKIAKAATELLRAGEIGKGDSLINISIDLYPTAELFTYAEVLAQMPDMFGCNRIIDRGLSRAKAFDQPKMYYMLPFPQIKDGVVIYPRKLVELGITDILHVMGSEAFSLNKNYGSVTETKKSLSFIINLDSDGGTALSSIWNYNAKAYLYELQKKYDEAIGIRLLQNNKQAVLGLHLAKGDYQYVINECIQGNDAYSIQMLFACYTRLNENVKALRYYDKIDKVYKNTPNLIFTKALLDINLTNYTEAIASLNSILRNRKQDFDAVAKWYIYSALGRAYSGLNNFTKARDNFNIALLYDPEDKDALDGLSKLESKYAREVAGDRTAPAIEVTEPAFSGDFSLKTDMESVMIKGIIKDLNDIKDVTINGEKIYFQKDGNFWSDIKLVTGENKIVISANDAAGNNSKATYNITKQNVITNEVAVVPVEVKEGNNYCLLIAAQNYADTDIPSLENPIADAIKLKLALKNHYNFNEDNIISYFNPSSDELRRQLLELTNVIQPEDNLVIFYAGHGIWVDKEKKGYWLLTDAKRDDENTWLSNKSVLELISKLPSRHTLLITDACFSGSVFKTRGLDPNPPQMIRKMTNKICRVAITSGNDTVVPDKSIFMKYLLQALDANKDKYITAQKIFINQILEAVMTETKTEPRYGTLELAGHVGGDYIFNRTK